MLCPTSNRRFVPICDIALFVTGRAHHLFSCNVPSQEASGPPTPTRSAAWRRRFAAMLLSSTLGQHVGEASADTDTGVVGEGTAQGRATRTGHCTGLTG